MKTKTRNSIPLTSINTITPTAPQENKYSKELLIIFHAAMEIVGIQRAEKTTEDLNTFLEMAMTNKDFASMGTGIANKLTLINTLTANIRKMEAAMDKISDAEYNQYIDQFMLMEK